MRIDVSAMSKGQLTATAIKMVKKKAPTNPSTVFLGLSLMSW